MNLLPFLIILFLVGGNTLGGLKDLLARIDFSSFAPLFPLLGIKPEFADFICSEEFSSLLEGRADLNAILPLLAKFTRGKEEATSPSDDGNIKKQDRGQALDPIRKIAASDIEAALGNFFE